MLAFALGMMVVTGVEWLRGEPLSGGEGTTVGGIVRSQPDGGGDRDDAPPATRSSTTPSTGPTTVTVTQPPPTSADADPADPPSESGTPSTTAPDTTTDGVPTGSVIGAAERTTRLTVSSVTPFTMATVVPVRPISEHSVDK